MEHWQWFAALYALMSIIFLYLDYHIESRKIKLFFKCFPLVMLFVAVAKKLIDASAPVSPAAPGSVSKLSKLFWGLLFSCIGDAYLVFPSYFILGVAAFAISQSIYISMFGGGIAFYQNSTNTEIVIGLAVVTVSALIYISICGQNEATFSCYCCSLLHTDINNAMECSNSGT